MRHNIELWSVILCALLVLGVVAAVVRGYDDNEPPPIYVSIGQWNTDGEGHQSPASSRFRRYLSDRMGTRVTPATTGPGNAGTLDGFLRGSAEPEIGRAVQLLRELTEEDRSVVAITLGVGFRDLVDADECSATECDTVIAALRRDLDEIYARITAAKDPSTPLLVLSFYNPEDCGQSGVQGSSEERFVMRWNEVVRDIAERHDAFVVDLFEPFRGKACSFSGRDIGILDQEGMETLAEQYRIAYEALPDAYR